MKLFKLIISILIIWIFCFQLINTDVTNCHEYEDNLCIDCTCSHHTCEITPKDCNDNNPKTTDGCISSSGECINLYLNTHQNIIGIKESSSSDDEYDVFLYIITIILISVLLVFILSILILMRLNNK